MTQGALGAGGVIAVRNTTAGSAFEIRHGKDRGAAFKHFSLADAALHLSSSPGPLDAIFMDTDILYAIEVGVGVAAFTPENDALRVVPAVVRVQQSKRVQLLQRVAVGQGVGTGAKAPATTHLPLSAQHRLRPTRVRAPGTEEPKCVAAKRLQTATSDEFRAALLGFEALPDDEDDG